MNFVEYVEFTDTVALYPKEVENQYLALGIADELGELVLERETDPFTKEAGDCFWYLLRYAHYVLKVDLNDWYDRASQARNLPNQTEFLTAAIGYAGVICGYEKKKLRDGSTWDEKKAEAKRGAAEVACYKLLMEIIKLASFFGVSKEVIMSLNVQKLTGRKEAGTIKGDGGNR